jgi:hypothetical protein
MPVNRASSSPGTTTCSTTRAAPLLLLPRRSANQPYSSLDRTDDAEEVCDLPECDIRLLRVHKRRLGRGELVILLIRIIPSAPAGPGRRANGTYIQH